MHIICYLVQFLWTCTNNDWNVSLVECNSTTFSKAHAHAHMQMCAFLTNYPVILFLCKSHSQNCKNPNILKWSAQMEHLNPNETIWSRPESTVWIPAACLNLWLLQKSQSLKSIHNACQHTNVRDMQGNQKLCENGREIIIDIIDWVTLCHKHWPYKFIFYRN